MNQDEFSKSPSFPEEQIKLISNKRRGLLGEIGGLGVSLGGVSLGGGPPTNNPPPAAGLKPTPTSTPTGIPGLNPGPKSDGLPTASIPLQPTPTSSPNPSLPPGVPTPGPTPTPLPFLGPSSTPNLDPNASPVVSNTFPSLPTGANQTTPTSPLPTGNAIFPSRNPLNPNDQAAPNGSSVSTVTISYTPSETGRPLPHRKPPSNGDNSSSFTSLAATTTKTIAIIVGVLAGVYLLWTMFRKWYFRPSKKFEHKLDEYDEDLFKPRPPSFAEKRHNHNYGASSLRSGVSPSTERQYGHDHTGANFSPSSDGAYLRFSRGPTALSDPDIKFGEIHSYTPQNHSVEQEVRDAHEIGGHPSQGIFALADLGHTSVGSVSAANSTRKSLANLHEQLQIPPPVFDSNIRPLSEFGRGRKAGE